MRASVVICRDPFRPANHRSVDIVRRRKSLRNLAPRTRSPVICQVNGKWIPRNAWAMRLNDGDSVIFIALPQGGGGGGSNPLKAILMIAVMVFAAWAAQPLATMMGVSSAAGIAGVQAAIGLVGSMLVSALIPAAKATTASTANSLAAASPTYSLGAQGNSARLGQPIPAIYGRHMIYPDFGAQPYTEYAGNEQYLYQLFCIGQGEYDIEAIRIEDTPISSFPEINYEVVGPGGSVTLFPARVVTSGEVSGQEALTGTWVGGFVANDAGTQANCLAVDVVLSRGLYYANDSGGLSEVGLSWTVQVLPINDDGAAIGAWATVGNEGISAATTTPIRRSYRYSVALGRYQVRLLRTDAKNTDSRYGHEIDWAGLRAYLPGSQAYGNVTMVAMRMRATNSLSAQATRKINFIVTRRLKVWNPASGWSAATVATRSIAWAIADICRAKYGAGLSDSRIDLHGLYALDATLSARGDTFNMVFDSQSTVMEALGIAARAGRAVPFMQGGVTHVVRDQPATIPVALFSQRNIVKNSFSIDYLMASEDTADAIDVTYFDEAIWSERTVRAKLPGSAEKTVAQMKISGVTSRAQAWREAMYACACNRYRRRLPTWQTEMEGFIPTIGDLVAVQHDLPSWGQSGEIVAWNPATREAITSEPLTWTAGARHVLAFRGRDGSVIGPFYASAGTDAYRVVLDDWAAAGVPWSDGVSDRNTPDTGSTRERSHFAFGPSNTQYIRARMISLRPRSSETVEIAAVIESDYVHVADTGAVPGVNAWQLPTKITVPVVTSLSAHALPGNITQIILSWPPAAGADHYYVEQSSGDGHWTRVGDVGATSISTQALYGSSSIFRVAPIGMTQGAWREATYQALFSAIWNAGPQNFAAAVTRTGVSLSWDPVLHLDVTGYRITDGAGNIVGTVSASFFEIGYVSAGVHTWNIRAVNKRGELSPNGGTASVTVAAPVAPEVSSAFSGPDLVLSWAAPSSDQAIDRYQIRVGASSWDAAVSIGETYSTTFRSRVDWVGARNFWVAAIDRGGNVGAATMITPTVTAPGLPAVTAQVIDNNVLLYWSDATRTLPIQYYEIRRGDEYASATRVGTKQGLFTVLFESLGGVFCYWIAGVDSAGNVGTPAGISATVNEPPDYVLKADYYSKFSGAGTTLANALYEEATIVFPVNTTETVAGHFDSHGWDQPDDQIAAGYPVYIQPTPASGYFEQVIDYGAALASNKITVTPSITAVVGSPVISCRIGTSLDGVTWSDFDDVTQLYASNFRYARIRVTATGGLARMTDLNIRLDSKLHTVTGSLAVGAADVGGTTVYLTDDKTAGGSTLFVDVESVQVTPRGTVPCIAIFDIDDAPYPSLFKVLLYNMAGTRISGTVDYMVRGF